MKRLIVLVMLLAFILCLSAQAFASTAKEREVKIIYRNDPTENINVTTVHRVVVGNAVVPNNPNVFTIGNTKTTVELAPNIGNLLERLNVVERAYMSFWDKFTNGPYINVKLRMFTDPSGEAYKFTEAEKKLLDSIYPIHGAYTNVFVDLFDGTVKTAPFQNWAGSFHGAFYQLSQLFPDKNSSTTAYQVSNDQLDPYTIVQTSKAVVTTTKTTYTLIAGACESPIILDVDNNDKVDVTKNEWRPHYPALNVNSVRKFDMTGDGEEDFTEWMSASPNDALLCIPEDGRVESALQLFGTAGGYVDGYEKLSIVCDKDNNGWVEGEELKGLMLWKDANNNAICESGELMTLDECGVTAISTQHKDFKSTYKAADGHVKATWDWWPTLAEMRRFR